MIITNGCTVPKDAAIFIILIVVEIFVPLHNEIKTHIQ